MKSTSPPNGTASTVSFSGRKGTLVASMEFDMALYNAIKRTALSPLLGISGDDFHHQPGLGQGHHRPSGIMGIERAGVPCSFLFMSRVILSCIFPKARRFQVPLAPRVPGSCASRRTMSSATEPGRFRGVIKNRCAGEVRRLLAQFYMPPSAAAREGVICSSPAQGVPQPSAPEGTVKQNLGAEPGAPSAFTPRACQTPRSAFTSAAFSAYNAASFFLSPADGDGGLPFRRRVFLHGLLCNPC